MIQTGVTGALRAAATGWREGMSSKKKNPAPTVPWSPDVNIRRATLKLFPLMSNANLQLNGSKTKHTPPHLLLQQLSPPRKMGKPCCSSWVILLFPSKPHPAHQWLGYSNSAIFTRISTPHHLPACGYYPFSPTLQFPSNLAPTSRLGQLWSFHHSAAGDSCGNLRESLPLQPDRD